LLLSYTIINDKHIKYKRRNFMPQVGKTPIELYRSGTAAATPSAGNLVLGELALNYADGKLFYKDGAGIVKSLGKLPHYLYTNRNDLRNLTATTGDSVVVEGIGLFTFYLGSTEIDDDDSCFATSTGRWLLEAVSPDFMKAYMDFAAQQDGFKPLFEDALFGGI